MHRHAATRYTLAADTTSGQCSSSRKLEAKQGTHIAPFAAMVVTLLLAVPEVRAGAAQVSLAVPWNPLRRSIREDLKAADRPAGLLPS